MFVYVNEIKGYARQRGVNGKDIHRCCTQIIQCFYAKARSLRDLLQFMCSAI